MRRKHAALRAWLRATGIVYAAGAVDFALRPGAAPATLGRLGGAPLEEGPQPGLHHALASAYMATIGALCLGAARDPNERRVLIPPLLVAKAVSSSALLYRYRLTRKRGYALGAALDAAILGVTAALYAGLDDRPDRSA